MPVVDGISFSVTEGGKKTARTLVLIHGAGSSHLCWSAGMRRVTGWRVLALDLPGHGRSESAGQQSLEGYAEQVRAFLENQHIYRAVLVGHSMGGAVALQLALDHPGLVIGLGMISSGAYLGVPGDLLEALSSPSTLPVAIDLFQKKAFSSSTPQALIEQTMRTLRRVRPGVLKNDWLACARFDVRPRLNGIHIPVWAAVGAEDRLTPPAFSCFVSARLDNGRPQMIRNAGHMVIVEQPGELEHGLRLFLERLAREGGLAE